MRRGSRFQKNTGQDRLPVRVENGPGRVGLLRNRHRI